MKIVLERTEQLYRRLCELHHRSELPRFQARFQARLKALRERAAAEPKSKTLFMELCALRREMAMTNPLLDFDALLFTSFMGMTRYAPVIKRGNYGREGMADGRNGIYRVSGFKDGTPKFEDVLRKPTVQNGRYKGRTLSNHNPRWGGRAVLSSIDLSFDGKHLLFPWAESGFGGQVGGEDYWAARHYAPPAYGEPRRPDYGRGMGVAHHLFCLDREKQSIRQLTDSHFYDDFHAIWMPDDRVVFVSTRLRRLYRHSCKCDCATLFSMRDDGTDLFPLGWHELWEQSPSVDNNGMLIYSRWDQTQRNFGPYQIWTSYPDGRDPRALHGNYGPGRAKLHPTSNLSCQAIPGVQGKYVAVDDYPHGNLIKLDLNIPDGDEGNFEAFSKPLAIFTTNRKTGERTLLSQKHRHSDGNHSYCEPVPLSEDFCIAATGSRIVLVDAMGNEILLADAGSVVGKNTIRFPKPDRARPRPPVIPTATWQGARRAAAPKATIAVMNVYDAEYPFPEGTKIKALRVIQLPAKDWPLSGGWGHPAIGFSRDAQVRVVLGTAPVEADGSAHFEAPVEALIYFQALDGRGLAIQTMRSGTYVHPGERLTCAGCHEHKWKAPAMAVSRTSAVPLALQRPPSQLTPEPSGSLPLNYENLVKKPVFDKKCAGCHQRRRAEWTADKGAKPISFKYARHDMQQHKTSSDGDLRKYVYFIGQERNVGGEVLLYRSLPGKSGALASPLLNFLDKRHHGVKLTPEEYRRVTLWLDCNAVGASSYSQDVDPKKRMSGAWPERDVDPMNPSAVQQETAGMAERIERSGKPDEAVQYLDSPSWMYRVAAARALGRLRHAAAAERLKHMAIEDARPEVRAAAFHALYDLEPNTGQAFVATAIKAMGNFGRRGFSRGGYNSIRLSDTFMLLAGTPWVREALLKALKEGPTDPACELLVVYWPEDHEALAAMRRMLFEPKRSNAFRTLAYGHIKTRTGADAYPDFLLRVVKELRDRNLLVDAVEQALVFSPPLERVVSHVTERCLAEDPVYMDAVAAVCHTPFPDAVLPMMRDLLARSKQPEVRRWVFGLLPRLRTQAAFDLAATAIRDEPNAPASAQAFLTGFSQLPMNARTGRSTVMGTLFNRFYAQEKSQIKSVVGEMLTRTEISPSLQKQLAERHEKLLKDRLDPAACRTCGPSTSAGDGPGSTEE